MKTPKISVLVEGYAKKEGESWKASSTATLIETGEHKIIVDPGCNRNALIESLSKRNIDIPEIGFVVLTHAHLDHTLLAGIFVDAKFVTHEAFCLYDNDRILPISPDVLGKDIQILKTPGHVHEHISLIINTKEGKVGVVGDLFFWLDDEKQVIDIYKKDQAQCFSTSHEDLVKSRKKIVEACDTIIPGHGRVVKVKDE